MIWIHKLEYYTFMYYNHHMVLGGGQVNESMI